MIMVLPSRDSATAETVIDGLEDSEGYRVFRSHAKLLIGVTKVVFISLEFNLYEHHQ